MLRLFVNDNPKCSQKHRTRAFFYLQQDCNLMLIKK